MVTWSCLGVSIRASPNLDILGVKFDSELTFEDHVCGIVSRVSENWYFEVGETYICGHLGVTSLLFSICLQILEYFPPVEESDDLVILGVAFDSKMTFEKHHRSVSRAASQRLGILIKSWHVFRDRSLLVRCFRGFVLPVLEYCSAVWCSSADTHLKLLDRAVSGARFLAGGVFECDISHRQSVAVLCMLYKIRCNPVHPLNGALPGPYVPVRFTRGALVAHRYTYSPPRCRTLQYSRSFIPFSVSL